MDTVKAKSNVRQATYEVLESYPAGQQFSSDQLRNQVVDHIYTQTGELRVPHIDTVLRYVREKRHELGIYCTSRERSSYIKVGA